MTAKPANSLNTPAGADRGTTTLRAQKSGRPRPGRPLRFAIGSIILGAELEIGLRMAAHRADLRGVLADMDMAAVGAFPDHDGAFFEDFAVLDVLQKLEIALLVGLFDRGDALEFGGDLKEALFPRLFGKGRVHLVPLVMLAGGGGEKVLGRGFDLPAHQIFVPEFGVLLLVAGRLLKDVRDLVEALFSRFAAEIGVLVSGLGFARERGHEIFLGFAAFEFHNNLSFFYNDRFILP